MKKIAFAIIVAMLSIVGCSKQKSGTVQLTSDTDTLAYIIGMNIGENVMHMDSTINVEALCRGIRDLFGGQTILTREEARTYYLRHVNFILPERARGYEDEFLAEFAASNRSYARTRSGVTYTVESVGDQELIPQADRDSVVMLMVVRGMENDERYSSYTAADTLHRMVGDLADGVKESLRFIGKGGQINAWIPSKEAFGADGCDSLNVKPNETLYFEIKLLEVDKFSTRRSRRNN